MESESFRFTAAACHLAQCVYYARCEAYGHLVPDGKHWDALDYATRSIYITQASDMLKAHRPIEAPSPLFQAFAGITRAHAAKVVGRISEREPYGVSVNDEVTK